jgi:hypothetical protein
MIAVKLMIVIQIPAKMKARVVPKKMEVLSVIARKVFRASRVSCRILVPPISANLMAIVI